MPTNVSPQKMQQSVHTGFKRWHNARQARLMFLRNYTGQYYDRAAGDIGTEPLNLIFNAIRVLVPNIVMNHPKHRISTDMVPFRQYAETLGLALDQNGKRLNLRDTYRRAIVDAVFCMGITKTGLCESGSAVYFDEYDQLDPGEVYTEGVSLDHFVCDPNLRGPLHCASWMGDRIRLPRMNLLDSGLYNNEYIERLPSCYDMLEQRADSLSMRNITDEQAAALQEEVEIVELWVPQAKALVTVPGSDNVTFDDYLRVDDYEGPDTGPYSFLILTPPVPDNPIPISMVGIWTDLHVMANKMARKIMNQADRQKDVLTYRRANADDAQEIVDASDGESVAVEDTAGIAVHSFGGQQQSNEVHVQQLQGWFNMMAGNPQSVGGQTLDADSATEAQILQGNASVSLEDMKDMVYNFAADEARKRMFYLHTDPLMNIPIAKREPITVMTPMGPQTIQQEVQVVLTPEAREGDWLDYTMEIQPESMTRVDSRTRMKQSFNFAVQVIPAAATAAQTCMALGIPFSLAKYLSMMAKEAGIDWMDEVLFDPELQMQMVQRMMAGPQPGQSQGQAVPGQGPASPAAIAQNGQPANVGASQPGAATEQRQAQQAGANDGQQAVKRGY